MNFKKYFIGFALVGSLSVGISVRSTAMMSNSAEPFSDATYLSEQMFCERRFPITYDEVSDQATESAEVPLEPTHQEISEAERVERGGEQYKLAMESKNEKEAFEHFKNAAWYGNVDALSVTGHCYEEGEGVSQNLFIALRYFEKAHEKGLMEAQGDIDRIRHKLSLEDECVSQLIEDDCEIIAPEASHGGVDKTSSSLLEYYHNRNCRVSIDPEDFNIYIEEIDIPELCVSDDLERSDETSVPVRRVSLSPEEFDLSIDETVLADQSLSINSKAYDIRLEVNESERHASAESEPYSFQSVRGNETGLAESVVSEADCILVDGIDTQGHNE